MIRFKQSDMLSLSIFQSRVEIQTFLYTATLALTV